MNQKYECHICMETAEKPVVTPCGHLFCWVCIYHWLRSNQEYLTCPICKSGLEISMLRPILMPREPPEKAENGIPPRPRPIRKLKINKEKYNKLPKSISSIGMNMYRGVLLAGYGIFPSFYMMLFQKHKKPLPNENTFGESVEHKIYEYLEMGRFLLVILLVLFLLLL